MGRDMKNTYAVSTRGGVAVIPVTGPLFRHANLLTAVCGATSYELLAQDFNKALNDPNISAILFDVDSPGGIECTYDFQGAKNAELGKMVTVQLINDVEEY